MAKKRKCRMTEAELNIHEEAVRLRKMTDRQLVEAFRNAPRAFSESQEAEPINKTNAVTMLLEGLARGDWGARCFVIISFGFKLFYKIPWEQFQNMKEIYGRKYITSEEVKEYRIKYAGGVLEFLEQGGQCE